MGNDPFWQNTRLLTLRRVWTITNIQFTLRRFYQNVLSYGEGAEIGSTRALDYALPAVSFRIYEAVAGQTDWTRAAEPTRQTFEGAALATKLLGTNTEGDPVFEVQLRIPREAVTQDRQWLVWSPRMELSGQNGFHQFDINPYDENLTITSLVHDVPGLNAHLVTRISDTVSGDVHDALVQTLTKPETGHLDLQRCQAYVKYPKTANPTQSQ